MIKRPFMLLEVMIAFALVVLCVLPMLAPHVAMLKAERQFIQKVELDHVVNLLYGSILEQLYTNQIGWEELMKIPFPITKEQLERIGYKDLLGYQGSYNFFEEPPDYKPRDLNAPYSLYLLNLTFNFIDQKKNPVKYRYKVFVVRDKRPESAPAA